LEAYNLSLLAGVALAAAVGTEAFARQLQSKFQLLGTNKRLLPGDHFYQQKAKDDQGPSWVLLARIGNPKFVLPHSHA
jgi:hypothetical protein